VCSSDLVTTLTKRTAEDLTAYLSGHGLKVRYLHSDIDSLTRIGILRELRLGKFDVLVGINLLREGLDLPEVSLVAILDAANEGFLRSATTLIQIAGRAARHLTGQVVLYADSVTGSMQRALDEMDRRRKLQLEHNRTHNITPRGIRKAVQDLEEFQSQAKTEALQLVRGASAKPLTRKNLPHLVDSLDHQMREAAENLDFELAAALRDQIIELREMSGLKGFPGAAKPRGKKAAKTHA
jgi:excinuclease ABC subunit B